MIFLVYTSNHSDNELLYQEAAALSTLQYSYAERKRWSLGLDKAKRGEVYDSNDISKPLAQLKKSETLYIVGHGSRGDLQLSGYSPEELLNILLASGLNPYLKDLKITLVSCHSGYRKDIWHKSFAQILHELLLARMNSLEVLHREREGSLPTIKAPKHVVGYRLLDGKAIGLKPCKYLAYERIKRSNNSHFHEWIDENALPLDNNDYQFLTTSSL